MSNRLYKWTANEESHKYDDIIDLPHFESNKHPHMSMSDRAAQFSPFDALNGYSEEIAETGRIKEERIVLSETQKEKISNELLRLNSICLQINHERYNGNEADYPSATVTFFVTDKSGHDTGSYKKMTGRIKYTNLTEGYITIIDQNSKNRNIRINDISDINGSDSEN
jgi:hypothetical protein